MKAKTSTIIFALCLMMSSIQSAFPQSPLTRPRRVSPTQPGKVESATISLNLYEPRGVTTSTPTVARASTLESLVPRDGLQFYFEIRSGGLTQLAQMAATLGPIAQMLVGGGKNLQTSELTGFVMRNLGALSSARLALVSYGASAAVIIEATNSADGQKLKAELDRMLGSNRPGHTTDSIAAAAGEVTVGLRERTVMVGTRGAVERLAESNGVRSLADDQEFLNARTRFSDDPFFAYVELGSSSLLWPSGNATREAAYTASMLATLTNMPHAVAVGGTIQPDATRLRALVIYGAKQSEGLFSSILSSARPGQSMAANFAAPDTEVFVDVMLDWDKLYNAIQSLFEMFAGASVSARNGGQVEGVQPSTIQGGDLLAMAEASLGFSIKNDLIPTLGNEVAITLSGLGELRAATAPARAAGSNGRQASGVSKKASPRFMLMLAVRDPIKFEKYLNRIFTETGGRASQPFARMSYRGATINYRKDMAYTISGGFMIAGGSVAEIRRALDGRALGSSLASTAEFRSAMGSARPAMLQGYVSASLSSKLSEMFLAEAVKSNSDLARLAQAAQIRSALSLVMLPDADNIMIEMRLPTNLAVMALASVATSKTNPYGINSSQPERSRAPGGRKTPTLTDEDLRSRRP